MSETFRALVLDKTEEGQRASFRQVDEDFLMEGDVDVDIAYSTVNYKDGLAITGKAPIARTWPLIPGIDFSGTVRASRNPDFAPGDEVILTGWGVGESHHGGYAGRARVKGGWLVPLPEGLSLDEAMAIGTAGLTAMLCVMRLQELGVSPQDGEVLVTGASGGVGSVATAVLAGLGFAVTAATGKPEEADYLKKLGAAQVMDRAELSGPPRPLAKARWAAAVDVAGSVTLANVLSQMQRGGVVAACGLAQGMDLPATVAPFILRGVTLAGIDSVTCPKERRIAAWSRLARELDKDRLAAMTRHITLDEVPETAARITGGKVRGRIVVDIRTGQKNGPGC